MPAGLTRGCLVIIGAFAFITSDFAHVMSFFDNLRRGTGSIEIISLFAGIIGTVQIAGAGGSGIGSGSQTGLPVGKEPGFGQMKRSLRFREFRNSQGGVVCV